MSAAPALEPAALRTRAVLALTFVLARYVPLPILDDLVRDRIGRVVVAKAADAQRVTLTKEEAAMMGASSEGCLGCLLAGLWLPVRLLLYPFRALLGIVLGVRWASRDLVEVFALGRTVDGLLTDGRYPRDAPVEARLAYARDARRAFDLARRGLDTHAVQGLLSLALGPLRKVLPAAMRPLRRFWHGDANEPAPTGAVDAPASRLAAALDDPRMVQVLITIDRRFDEALLVERASHLDRT
jgi:hypothetical protein